MILVRNLPGVDLIEARVLLNQASRSKGHDEVLEQRVAEFTRWLGLEPDTMITIDPESSTFKERWSQVDWSGEDGQELRCKDELLMIIAVVAHGNGKNWEEVQAEAWAAGMRRKG